MNRKKSDGLEELTLTKLAIVLLFVSKMIVALVGYEDYLEYENEIYQQIIGEMFFDE